MTEEQRKYDPKRLTDIACNFYHAIKGEKPDEAVRGRLGAGVEGIIGLYETDPRLLLALAEGVGPLVDQYIERTFGYKSYSESQRVTDNLFKGFKELFKI